MAKSICKCGRKTNHESGKCTFCRPHEIKVKKKNNTEKAERTRMLHLWMYSLWVKMGNIRKCKSCDKRIYGEFSTIYFDHLLAKSKYPQFEFEEENIFFCCADCHSSKENGFPTEKHKQSIITAKQKFLNL